MPLPYTSESSLLVAAWIGSTNLGDELVFEGLRRKLQARGVAPVAISVDAGQTTRDHGVAAIGSNPVVIRRSARRVSGLVIGGGGFIQDKTSHLNMPYHLARVEAARARGLPVAGIGLGVGPVETRLGGVLARRILRGAVGVSVRDDDSAALLRRLGIQSAVVAADLAFALPLPEVETSDVLVAALRPWTDRRSMLPVGMRPAPAPAWFLDGMAAALDEAARRTGLAVRLVALQADRDGEVHRQVASRMRTAVSLVEPGVNDVVREVAEARVVVAMRYHAAVAAALGGRPAVLVGYSDKVLSLGRDLGAGAVTLRWAPGDVDRLGDGVEAVLGRGDAMVEARDALRRRERGNDEVLDRLLELG